MSEPGPEEPAEPTSRPSRAAGCGPPRPRALTGVRRRRPGRRLGAPPARWCGSPARAPLVSWTQALALVLVAGDHGLPRLAHLADRPGARRAARAAPGRQPAGAGPGVRPRWARWWPAATSGTPSAGSGDASSYADRWILRSAVAALGALGVTRRLARARACVSRRTAARRSPSLTPCLPRSPTSHRRHVRPLAAASAARAWWSPSPCSPSPPRRDRRAGVLVGRPHRRRRRRSAVLAGAAATRITHSELMLARREAAQRPGRAGPGLPRPDRAAYGRARRRSPPT